MLPASRLAIGLILALAGAGAAPAAGDPLAALQAAIATETERNGAASPYLLPLFEQLARLQFRTGDLTAATAAQRRNLTVAVTMFGSASPSSAEAMTALAEAKLDQLHYLDAEALLIAADNAIAAPPGDDGQALVPVLAGLARIALARGDLAVARARAEQAVALRAKNPFPRSAEALRVLGAVLAAQRDFDAGETALNQAIAFDRAKRDSENLETARSLSQLGNLYLRAERFGDALAPLEEAAAIDQDRLGPAHPFIADDLHDLGIAYDGLKRPGDARRVLADAVERLRHGTEKTSPRIAFCELELARIDRAAGDSTEADAEFRRARRLLDATEQEEHNRERQI